MSIARHDDPAVATDPSSEAATLREQWRELDQRLRQLPAYGSVEGFVEQMPANDAEQCFLISERIEGSLVNCRDENGVLAASGAGLEDRVRVGGKIDRDEGGRPVSIVVERIYRFPPDEELPTASDIRGIFPDLTGGMDATEWVKMRCRRRRDAAPLA
jgi:hypothetical protein